MSSCPQAMFPIKFCENGLIQVAIRFRSLDSHDRDLGYLIHRLNFSQLLKLYEHHMVTQILKGAAPSIVKSKFSIHSRE